MKTAVITGASRGLGRALALALTARGVRVVGVARGKEELDAVARAAGAGFVGVVADVGDADAAARVAAQAMAALGEVDLLVHNASTLGPVPLRPLLDLSAEAVADVFRVNVVGPHALTRRLAGAMALRGQGTVAFVSSDAATEAYPDWGAYGASKAANDHMMRVLAAELAEVRFVAVDPGEMDTGMHADAVPQADPRTLRRPVDVAEALLAWLPLATSGERHALQVRS